MCLISIKKILNIYISQSWAISQKPEIFWTVAKAVNIKKHIKNIMKSFCFVQKKIFVSILHTLK